jgi:hypothetical protein
MERTGWWFWKLNNHPVCGDEDAIATFFSSPQPPLLARRGEIQLPFEKLDGVSGGS